MTVKPKTDTESADVDVAGISVKVKVHYPGRSHFAHESGAGLFSRFEKSAREGNRIPARTIGGDSFTSRTVRTLLGSPKIRGYGFFKDTWNQFPSLRDKNEVVRWNYYHGSVIDEQLYNLAQAILKENENKNKKSDNSKEVYLLSGVLNKSDGTSLTGASAKSGLNHYCQEKGKGGLRIQKNPIENIV